MVGPHSNGRIARSMVRIPGSGMSEEHLEPVCLNLGNVSNLAAMIPVPQTLNFKSLNGRHQLMSSISFSGTGKPEKPTSLETGDGVSPRDNADPSRPAVNVSDIMRTQETAFDRREMPTSSSTPSSSPPSSSSPSSSSPSSSPPTSSPSSSITTSYVGETSRGSSKLKRPMRCVSGEDASAQSPSKRYRVADNSQSSSTPTLPQTIANINWVLPTAGMLASGGNTPLLPVVLTSSSNIPLGIPVGIAPGNSHATSMLLPQIVLNNMASQGCTIQTNTNNTSATMTQQSTTIQPAPVTMVPGQTVVPAQTVPLLFSAVPNRGLQQMANERDQLKKENKALKYRLYRFHQLFKNKEKLMTVLRHMEAVPS